MERAKVVHSLEELASLAPRETAVTLGVFDGVHLGHRKIIDELVRCKESGAARGAYLITFDPHPVVVTHSRVTPPILTTIEERLELLRAFPLDGVFVMRFGEEIANTTYRGFLEKYLLRAFRMNTLVLGYDCRFGRGREGSPQRLREEAKKKRFNVKIIAPVFMDGRVISSTQIRNTVIEGRLDSAERLLGHPYLVAGKVVKGHGRGHSIGFPTANLSVTDPYKLWPPQGVYAVRVRLRGETRTGMMNVGVAPTLKALGPGSREIEVHIFDFQSDLYGETLFVYCCSYLRGERSFPSESELVAQLEEDKEKSLRMLGHPDEE